MRLFKIQEDGKLVLTKDLTSNIPPYAILSHTWGRDDDEVTFKDVIEDVGKHKDGYRKIQFCKKEASADSLQYFWVDSCCIDKSNSTELSQAINSMFRWYQNAAKCYVYLLDVSTDSYQESSFRKSRWFTRSWTLQELIAPSSVEFFSSEGHRLGDKQSLERQICKITGITAAALRGSHLSNFSRQERMLWAEGRTSKLEEDRAYSLFGIFGVYLPLIYGEGAKNAFIRLEEEIDRRSAFEHGLPRNQSWLSSRSPTRSMESPVPNEGLGDTFFNSGSGSQFNAPWGTQNNNTGGGNQFSGTTLSGPVYFGWSPTKHV